MTGDKKNRESQELATGNNKIATIPPEKRSFHGAHVIEDSWNDATFPFARAFVIAIVCTNFISIATDGSE